MLPDFSDVYLFGHPDFLLSRVFKLCFRLFIPTFFDYWRKVMRNAVTELSIYAKKKLQDCIA